MTSRSSRVMWVSSKATGSISWADGARTRGAAAAAGGSPAIGIMRHSMPMPGSLNRVPLIAAIARS